MDIPVEVFNDRINADVCKTRIDKFYCDIVDCVKVACLQLFLCDDVIIIHTLMFLAGIPM